MRCFSMDTAILSSKRVVSEPQELLKGLNDLIVDYSHQQEFDSCLNLIGKKKGRRFTV